MYCSKAALSRSASNWPLDTCQCTSCFTFSSHDLRSEGGHPKRNLKNQCPLSKPPNTLLYQLQRYAYHLISNGYGLLTTPFSTCYIIAVLLPGLTGLHIHLTIITQKWKKLILEENIQVPRLKKTTATVLWSYYPEEEGCIFKRTEQ